MALCITWEAKTSLNPSLFGEDSILEFLQVAALFATAAMAFFAGRLAPSRAPLSSLLIAAATIAFTREFDFALDRHLFDGAWQTVVFLTAALAITHTWQCKATLKPAIYDFINRPSFGLMASGFFTVFIFSRLLGRKVLWQAIMGEGYMRVVKNTVEESTELLGYSLILIGSIEFLSETLRLRRGTRHASELPPINTLNRQSPSPTRQKRTEQIPPRSP